MCACSPVLASAAPDTHDADVKAIKDTETAWMKDAATKDVEKLRSTMPMTARFFARTRRRSRGKTTSARP